MSFRWAIPTHRVGHRSLPPFPLEIYLEILEHLAPPGQELSPEQTKTLTRVAGTCKFFCHIAIPRIYEHVSVVGSVYYRHDNAYSNRGASLCGRIVAREDLALWAAKCVRECNFHNWLSESEESWAVSIFAERYASSLRYMTNIHRLTFSECFITNEHWRAIMELGGLEELVFDRCHFTETIQLGGTRINQPPKLRVSSIEVYEGDFHSRVVAEVLDLGRLRSLKTDLSFAKFLDWPQDCALRQLHLDTWYVNPEHRSTRSTLRRFLQQTARFVVELKLSFLKPILLEFKDYFQDSLPDNFQNLRSLTLIVNSITVDRLRPREMSDLICRCVGFSPTMESLTVQAHVSDSMRLRFGPLNPWQPSPDYLRQNALPLISAAFPNINYVEIYGGAIRLQGASWVDVLVP
ncbi:hypothetical protein EDD16DRAFT_1606353 [Pisolithus croceorrhizus]|nr:hypothetical protein EDD16DRAFT_1606353 [Pisolithus croceorrhizus]KAI6122552.1 hypothetical protein EV401DRAFT_1950513 [Pisolithus croceorrhizus]